MSAQNVIGDEYPILKSQSPRRVQKYFRSSFGITHVLSFSAYGLSTYIRTTDVRSQIVLCWGKVCKTVHSIFSTWMISGRAPIRATRNKVSANWRAPLYPELNPLEVYLRYTRPIKRPRTSWNLFSNSLY
jgi:hypothetical protein